MSATRPDPGSERDSGSDPETSALFVEDRVVVSPVREERYSLGLRWRKPEKGRLRLRLLRGCGLTCAEGEGTGSAHGGILHPEREVKGEG